MYKVIQWFKNLDKNKQILIGLIIAICILGGLTSIMKGWRDDQSNWDYTIDKIDSKILEGSTVVYDRQIYWTLKSIVDKYTDSYMYEVSKEFSTGAKVSYKKYYEELDSGYKKAISKSEYEKKATELFSNIVIQHEQFEEQFVVLQNTIEKINKYGTDMYLCTIKVDAQDGIEIIKGRGYIGIKLNQKAETFSIFYLGGQYE